MPVTLTRTILVILIPGGIALISWILFFLMEIDTKSADSFYQTYTWPLHLCFFAAIVIAGTVLEGISTHLEVRWDGEREAELSVRENWYSYLTCSVPNEPVAFRYITRMVTSMYFELGMMWSSLSFGIGLAAIICSSKPSSYQCWAMLSIILSVLSVIYFYWQAKTSHKVLCEVRKQFVERSQC